MKTARTPDGRRIYRDKKRAEAFCRSFNEDFADNSKSQLAVVAVEGGWTYTNLQLDQKPRAGEVA